MRNSIYAIIYLFILLFFMGCNSTETYSSYAPSITMSDGEVVTYKFTYADGSTTTHTITKVSDGNEQGEIIYSISNGKTSNYILSELAPKNIPLSDEESFLMFGGSSLLKKVDNSNSTNIAEGIDVPNTTALIMIEESCTQTMFTVGAGEFLTHICKYVAEDNSSSFTKYQHISLEANTPLGGRLKYQESNSKEEVTVELIEWNGL